MTDSPFVARMRALHEQWLAASDSVSERLRIENEMRAVIFRNAQGLPIDKESVQAVTDFKVAQSGDEQ